MRNNHSKVVIIGAGAVGSTTAYSLVVTGVTAEVVLLDINKKKAQGEALDIQHSINFQSRNVRVRAGDYEDCSNADIVVITASAPYNGESSRLDMMDKTAAIVTNIVPAVMESGFDGIFVVVSNPVDIISYLVWKLSGLPKNRVIGTGTALESARLKYLIGDIMNMDPRSVDCFVMGEHGDSMMIPWSHIRAGGKNFIEVIQDNPKRFRDVNLNHLADLTKNLGSQVLAAKGNTQYGIASTVSGIVRSILHDENNMIPVSAYLDGEYGENGIFCGVPVILNSDGVCELGEFHLTAEEEKLFKNSVNVIRDYTARLHL